MFIEGTIRNGVVVLDPSAESLPEGTRVQIAASTGMEPVIRKTPGICGGNACIGRRRIAIWMLVENRDQGMTDDAICNDYDPPITRGELLAAWEYAHNHADEIARAIRENSEA